MKLLLILLAFYFCATALARPLHSLLRKRGEGFVTNLKNADFLVHIPVKNDLQPRVKNELFNYGKVDAKEMPERDFTAFGVNSNEFDDDQHHQQKTARESVRNKIVALLQKLRKKIIGEKLRRTKEDLVHMHDTFERLAKSVKGQFHTWNDLDAIRDVDVLQEDEENIEGRYKKDSEEIPSREKKGDD